MVLLYPLHLFSMSGPSLNHFSQKTHPKMMYFCRVSFLLTVGELEVLISVGVGTRWGLGLCGGGLGCRCSYSPSAVLGPQLFKIFKSPYILLTCW